MYGPLVYVRSSAAHRRTKFIAKYVDKRTAMSHKHTNIKFDYLSKYLIERPYKNPCDVVMRGKYILQSIFARIFSK